MRDKNRFVIVLILSTLVIFDTGNTPKAFSQTISCNFPIKIMPVGNSITDGYFHGGPLSVILRTRYRNLCGYSLLLNPVGMSIDPVTELIQWTPSSDQVGFHDVVVQAQNTEGIYTQNFTVSITRLSEIIGTWSSGIWYYNFAASKWTKITSFSTSGDIAAGDFSGDGKADVVSNWSSGLWYQNGATLGWTKVTSSASNRVTAGDVTGN